MCAILLEQFNSVFTTPLPNKQVIDPYVFFSVESIAYQDDELFLTESIIIYSIRSSPLTLIQVRIVFHLLGCISVHMNFLNPF